MGDVQQPYLFLGNFIQLVQLWAAICLLFFYVPLLTSTPLKKALEKLYNNFKEFAANHNVAVTDSKKLYDPTKWNKTFHPRIKSMAAMSFFYCVFLLVYIGAIRTWKSFYPIQHPSFLVISNCLIFLYLIHCSFLKYQSFNKFIAPVKSQAYFILFIFIFFLFYEFFQSCFYSFHSFLCDAVLQLLPNGKIWLLAPNILVLIICFIWVVLAYCFQNVFYDNIILLSSDKIWLYVTILTLITCFSGVVLIIIRIIYDQIVLILTKKQITKKLKGLSDSFKSYNNTINKLIRRDEYEELDENDKRIIDPYLIINDEQFQNNKRNIIKQVKNLDERFFSDNVSRQIVITELKTNNSYNDLTSDIQSIIRDICISFGFFNIDRNNVIDKLTSQLSKNFQNEFSDYLIDESKDKLDILHGKLDNLQDTLQNKLDTLQKQDLQKQNKINKMNKTLVATMIIATITIVLSKHKKK